MPEIKFKTKDEIPEEFRAEAKEVDGSFTVNLVLNSKLAEFRDRNIAVMQERDGLKAKVTTFETLIGADPDKFKAELEALRATDQQVKDGKLTASKTIDEEVSRRLNEGKAGYEAQIKTLANERDSERRAREASDAKFRRSIIDREITNAALSGEAGINPAALPDILTRAHAIYQVGENDALVPKRGDTIIYGSDGVSPMQPKEWLKKLVAEAPHFAKPSSGGGAAGGGSAEFGGMAQADFLKLPATERMRVARQAKA